VCDLRNGAMSMTNKIILRWSGVIGLVLVGVGMLVVVNWDAVSRNLGESLDTQARRTEATLFRLGELMSISAALKAQYGVEPDVSYETSTGDRILGISFSTYSLPGSVTTEAHAREIAAFAIGKTTKFEQIDAVNVLFQTSSKNGVAETANDAESYSFALDDLKPNQSQARPQVR
jgi:hypothetical protein